jgi:hypothetical protein
MNNFQAGLVTAEQMIKRDLRPFSDFLNELKIKVRRIFNNRENNDQLSLNRGIPPFALRERLWPQRIQNIFLVKRYSSFISFLFVVADSVIISTSFSTPGMNHPISKQKC